MNGGDAQNFRAAAEIAQNWWTLFHSDALDRLIQDALRDSPTVAAASATLRQAQAAYAAQSGTLWPAVNAQVSAAHNRGSGASLGLPTYGNEFSLYNAGVSVSYALDVFGGERRQLEGLRAQIDFQSYQLEGARLALTANIATAAVREAALRAQIDALDEVQKLQQAQLDVVERRFALGAIARADVLAQRTALAQTRASLPPLQKQLAQTRHQLAVLAGRVPSDDSAGRFDLDALELPAELPVSVPSALVRQRPDILAAEALLHAASAQIGVATANLYPQVTLGGSYGAQSLRPQQLFKAQSVVWGLSAGVLQPVFRGGTLQAQRRAALAAFDAAAANYRQTVLVAFENVADALRALDFDAQALQAQVEALNQAQQTLDMANKQFTVGGVSYLTLLNAQAQYQQARSAAASARAARYADTAALFQALGGGWWNGAALTSTQPTANRQ